MARAFSSEVDIMRLAYSIPVVVFLILIVVFFVALRTENLDELSSTLIGKEVRPFDLPVLGDGPALDENKRFSDGDLKKGHISVVNFWASWCGPCRIEHAQLMTLSERADITLYGINYKDEVADARAFLDNLGDPFELIGFDEAGRAGIEWGITGVPETFIVDGDGRVILKHVGPLLPADLARKIMPALAAAQRP